MGHGWIVPEFYGDGATEEAVNDEMGCKDRDQWAAAILFRR